MNRQARTDQRPTRAEVHHDRQTRGDYRMRTHVLRSGVPPTPEYRRARAELDQLTQRRRDDQDTNP